MREDTETAARRALLEKGEELLNRIAHGEDVHAELRLWQKRVERMTPPLVRLWGNIIHSYRSVVARLNGRRS
jgi:hypothetical protein